MNKIIITGGDGMVGSQVKYGTRLGKDELDILDSLSIDSAINKYKPDVIIHVAAIVDMAWAEEHKEETWGVNVTGTENIARACKTHNIRLVYMSSCAVFEGIKSSPYSENDEVKSINVYGKTKFAGEEVVRNILPESSLIIRTGWLFGGGDKDKKFIKMFYEKFKNGEEITAVCDRYGSPTYIPDLLSKILELIESGANSTYHVVNDGCVSYYEVAKEIKNIGNFANNIKKVLYKDLPASIVPRGNMEALVSLKISMRPWQGAVREYLTY